MVLLVYSLSILRMHSSYSLATSELSYCAAAGGGGTCAVEVKKSIRLSALTALFNHFIQY